MASKKWEGVLNVWQAKIFKETLVSYFQMLSWYLPGVAEKNHKPQSGWAATCTVGVYGGDGRVLIFVYRHIWRMDVVRCEICWRIFDVDKATPVIKI
jgi:hypothetical protein